MRVGNRLDFGGRSQKSQRAAFAAMAAEHIAPHTRTRRRAPRGR
jgi:hypothetical protein